MEESELLKLKTDLNFSVEKLKDISKELPKKINDLKSYDSYGEDGKNLHQIIEGIQNRLIQYSKDLESPFKIAVVGSQGTGKSSIVNLLLGDALMPSSTMENESAVIRLAYPPDDKKINKALFELNNGSTKLMDIDQANLIIDKAERTEENETLIKEVKYVSYYLKNKSLKDIEIINTPGMNVLTEDFYPRVQHLFSEADVILWVNSSEQILDKFNSWLIEKIHADNDKIVGFITFPDKLYRQDENNGVTDVVKQFMTNLEKDRLLRINGEIGLFILNGKFAQIAHSQKNKLKFINDVEEIEDEEDKLRMIYNFRHHGFAYSDDEKNKTILEKYNLYGIKNEDDFCLEMDFNLENFFQYCLNQNLCELNKNKTSAYYTKKGRELVGEVSQYNAFGRFIEGYLIPKSKESKLESVKGRLKKSLSTKDNENNSISRLTQIKEILIKEKHKLNEQENKRIENSEYVINKLQKEFKDYRNRNLGFASDNFAEELGDMISDRIDSEIGIYEFFKEILDSIIPNFLKRGKETVVSIKTSEIIEDSIQTLLPQHLKKLANESNNIIEIILLKMQQDYVSNKNVKNRNSYQNQQGISADLDFTRIFKIISKQLKPLLENIIKELFQNIAKKDLRRGSNTFLKKNVIKPIVKLIRKLLKKQAEKVALQKTAKAGAKVTTGIGLAWAIYDVISVGNDLRLMYKKMKDGIKQSLKEEDSFKNIFEEEANRNLDYIIDSVTNDLNRSFASDKTNVEFILHGINTCDKVTKELKKFNVK